MSFESVIKESSRMGEFVYAMRCNTDSGNRDLHTLLSMLKGALMMNSIFKPPKSIGTASSLPHVYTVISV